MSESAAPKSPSGLKVDFGQHFGGWRETVNLCNSAKSSISVATKKSVNKSNWIGWSIESEHDLRHRYPALISTTLCV